VAQVYALTDVVGLRYRALILLAAFTSLRWAELAALTPADIDLDARTVRVTGQLYYHKAGYSFRPPKSRAGVRVVAFPELIVSDVRKHLDWLPSCRRARNGHETAVRLPGLVNDLRPDRDSNAGPTADRENQ
jgi:integrase